MANYSMDDVKRLRELTAAGMMDCKNALDETDGDFDAAVEILRIKGAKDVGKRAGRVTANGLVGIELAGSGTGVMLEVLCETDFVAKGERFQQLGTALVAALVNSESADADALLSTAVAGGTAADLIGAESAALGEKIEIGRLVRITGDHVASYLHKTSPDLPPQIGVLVGLSGSGDLAEVGRDVAQHIAAFAPGYLSRDEVPVDVVDNERRIAEATSREEGKPEAALPRIVEGRVNGFFKDAVLGEQAFAKEPKKSVDQILQAAGAQVTGFARFKVGQA